MTLLNNILNKYTIKINNSDITFHNVSELAIRRLIHGTFIFKGRFKNTIIRRIND